MRVLSEKLRDPHTTSGYEEHGLFLFPNTDAGWLATVRRSSPVSLCDA